MNDEKSKETSPGRRNQLPLETYRILYKYIDLFRKGDTEELQYRISEMTYKLDALRRVLIREGFMEADGEVRDYIDEDDAKKQDSADIGPKKRKIRNKANRLLSIATRLGIFDGFAKNLNIDVRTVEACFKNPDKCKHNADLNSRRNTLMAIYFEAMRLLSIPLDDLLIFMRFYILYLDASPPSFGVASPKRQSLASKQTFLNSTLKCFDTSPVPRPVRTLNADAQLKATVEANLKVWEPGTVGVHAINITWQRQHKGIKGSDIKHVGGQTRVILIAERSVNDDGYLGFHLMTPETSDQDVAEFIKECLDAIEGENKVVRLVTTKRGDAIEPTAIDKDILQAYLGDLATVEEDVPTVAYRTPQGSSDAAKNIYRVPGRYASEEKLEEFLFNLMQEGRSLLKRLGEQKKRKKKMEEEKIREDTEDIEDF